MSSFSEEENTPEDDLRDAGQEGDVPAILKSLKEGADVNCKDSYVSAVFVSLPSFLLLFAFPFSFPVQFPSVV